MDRDYLKSGVTLIELMIAMVLALVLTFAVFFTYQSHSKSSSGQQEISEIQQDLMAIMDLMEKDIRNAGCNPLKSSSIVAFNAIPYSTVTTLGINADLYTAIASCANTSDGLLTCANEQVRYSFGNNELIRMSNKNDGSFSGLILSSNVSAFTMNCTTGSLGSPRENSVQTVTINLTLRGSKNDPDTGQPITRSQNKTIVVRNYGL